MHACVDRMPGRARGNTEKKLGIQTKGGEDGMEISTSDTLYPRSGKRKPGKRENGYGSAGWTMGTGVKNGMIVDLATYFTKGNERPDRPPWGMDEFIRGAVAKIGGARRGPGQRHVVACAAGLARG
jgi:hypothetical protein